VTSYTVALRIAFEETVDCLFSILTQQEHAKCRQRNYTMS